MTDIIVAGQLLSRRTKGLMHRALHSRDPFARQAVCIPLVIPAHDLVTEDANKRILGWRFSAQRMVMDYVLKCYIPAAGGTSSVF